MANAVITVDTLMVMAIFVIVVAAVILKSLSLFCNVECIAFSVRNMAVIAVATTLMTMICVSVL
jgi:hypothetical protein